MKTYKVENMHQNLIITKQLCASDLLATKEYKKTLFNLLAPVSIHQDIEKMVDIIRFKQKGWY